MKPDFASAPAGVGVGGCMPSPGKSLHQDDSDGCAIRTASPEVLLSIDFLMALALRLQQLGLSRQRAADWFARVLYGSPGPILTFEGHVIEIHDQIFEDVHGEDPSWTTDVKVFATRRPLRRPKDKMLRRFQLYDAAFKILGQPIELPQY